MICFSEVLASVLFAFLMYLENVGIATAASKLTMPTTTISSINVKPLSPLLRTRTGHIIQRKRLNSQAPMRGAGVGLSRSLVSQQPRPIATQQPRLRLFSLPWSLHMSFPKKPTASRVNLFIFSHERRGPMKCLPSARNCALTFASRSLAAARWAYSNGRLTLSGHRTILPSMTYARRK